MRAPRGPDAETRPLTALYVALAVIVGLLAFSEICEMARVNDELNKRDEP